MTEKKTLNSDKRTALGLVFSARKHGNTLDYVNYCMNKLKDLNIETTLTNIYDYNIEPCSHCNYECYSNYIRDTVESCPKKDDLPAIYEKVEKSDIVLFGIPSYVAHVPSLFQAFQERMLGVYQYGGLGRALKGKTFGFIGVSSNIIIEEAMRLFLRHGGTTWISINASEYGYSNIRTGAIEVPDIRKRLDRFTERLVS